MAKIIPFHAPHVLRTPPSGTESRPEGERELNPEPPKVKERVERIKRSITGFPSELIFDTREVEDRMSDFYYDEVLQANIRNKGIYSEDSLRDLGFVSALMQLRKTGFLKGKMLSTVHFDEKEVHGLTRMASNYNIANHYASSIGGAKANAEYLLDIDPDFHEKYTVYQYSTTKANGKVEWFFICFLGDERNLIRFFDADDFKANNGPVGYSVEDCSGEKFGFNLDRRFMEFMGKLLMKLPTFRSFYDDLTRKPE